MGQSQAGLREAFATEQQATLARIGDTPLSELPSVQAWRRAFSAFGVKPTQYRSACEALLRRLTKKGRCAEYQPAGGHWQPGEHSLRTANRCVRCCERYRGQSRFILLMAASASRSWERTRRLHPEPGEVVFSDENRHGVGTALVLAAKCRECRS